MINRKIRKGNSGVPSLGDIAAAIITNRGLSFSDGEGTTTTVFLTSVAINRRTGVLTIGGTVGPHTAVATYDPKLQSGDLEIYNAD